MASEEPQTEWDPEAELPEEADASDDLQVDDALLAQLSNDARLTSGLPEDQQYDDEAFIQQSGLTRPPVELAKPEAVETPPENLDPEGPLSFYEAGVQDVDGGDDPQDEVLGKAPDPPRGDAVESNAEEELAAALGDMAESDDEAEAPSIEPEPEPEPDEASAEATEELAAVLGDMAESDEDAPAPEAAEPSAPVTAADETLPMSDAEPDEEFVALPESDVEPEDPLQAMLGAMAESGEELIEEPPPTPVPDDGAPEDSDTPEMEEAAGAFDSLLQDLTVPEEETPRPEPTPLRTSIDEARDLMQKLEEQPREPAPAPEPPVQEEPPPPPPPAPEPDPILEPVAEAPAKEAPAPIWQPEPEPAPEPEPKPEPVVRERTVPELMASDPPLKEDEPSSRGEISYTYDAAPSRRQDNRAARRRARFLARAGVLALVVAAVVGGTIGYMEYVQPKILTPAELYARAESNRAAGDYSAAAADYTAFAERAPEDPRRGDAQFNAALATWMMAPESPAAKGAQDERVLMLLQSFLRDNNAHQKTSRAESMLGVVLHDLGRYDEAIEQLRASIDASDDPLAALPLSRTLASAYRRGGSIREAEATYLQAAALPGNYTPDQDYYDLGDMFAQLSETAESESDKMAYAAKAAMYLEDSTEVAGSNPDDRTKIEQRITMLRRATGMTDEVEAGDPMVAQEMAESEPVPAEASPVVMPPTAMDAAEPNPAAEAQALGHADIVQTEQP